MLGLFKKCSRNRVFILLIIILLFILMVVVLDSAGKLQSFNDGEIVRIDGYKDISHSYLIVNGPKSIIVDCGSSGIVERIMNKLYENNIKSEDVKFIVLTHTHFDHVRGVDDLKKKLKNAKVLIHEKEEERLIKGYSPLPPPTGHSSIWNNSLYGEEYYRIPKIYPDFVMKEDSISLNTKEFNELDGKIIWTPGHSIGSICIQIGEDIVVGDTIEGIGDSAFVSFADDLSALKRSWKTILDLGEVKFLHPSHGETYKAEVLKNDYKRFSTKYGV